MRQMHPGRSSSLARSAVSKCHHPPRLLHPQQPIVLRSPAGERGPTPWSGLQLVVYPMNALRSPKQHGVPAEEKDTAKM